MCGILALLRDNAIDPEDLKFIEELIASRGPDYKSELSKYETSCDLVLHLKASVLNLRISETEKQPTVDEKGNILLFNGQVYKFLGIPIENNVSDTRFLLDRLKFCETKDEVAETFAEIDGPFAFIYFHSDLKCLFYGRDIFGRRSLCQLVSSNSQYPLVISSIAATKSPQGTQWSEVDCSGFQCLDFSETNSALKTRFLWDVDSIYPRTNKCAIQELDGELRTTRSHPVAPLNDDRRPAKEFSDIERELALVGLEEKLLQAIRIRLHTGGNKCLLCKSTGVDYPSCKHCKVAVAFSGGIDSTLLALAIDKVLDAKETIDLVTVAFKENSPDRQSVIDAFRELCKLSSRQWRLVACDVSKQELETKRSEMIKFLISPCKTVIDDSLGCACWFIGRAEGRVLEAEAIDDIETFAKYDPDHNNTAYSGIGSMAAVFFVGASIDEQLGGYGSHRSAWSNRGFEGLFEEISFLMRRISSRNLGRDDRTYAHHGRDVKLPYLDFELVSYLNQLPLSLKMDLSESSLEVGPKKILRELARHWGLDATSRRVKRALQFGTRIANLENPNEKGDDICSRLM